MRGLSPGAWRRRWNELLRAPGASDRGAIAATVAVLLGTGVLLGMATVVVDVGRLYAEREQLVAGADAAAWAVAENCALEPTTCADQEAAATTYAEANAADGAAAVSPPCGVGPGLPECLLAAGNRTDCLGEPPADVSYAQVHASTERADGGTLLPPVFAGALAGGDYEGSTVAACARVAWGPPRVASGFAVTFSTCEWAELTQNGEVYWPVPAVGTPPDDAEQVIYLKGEPGATTCQMNPPDWNAPGGFGWLDDPSGTDDGEPCEITVEVDGSFGGDTGNSVSHPCRTALARARASREPSVIPIYDGVLGQGTGATYHLAGFASFVLTGYDLGSFSAASWLTGRSTCSGNQRCLYGYFTRGLVPTTGGDIGGPDMGVSIVKLVG
jgi:hypothetical protein